MSGENISNSLIVITIGLLFAVGLMQAQISSISGMVVSSGGSHSLSGGGNVDLKNIDVSQIDSTLEGVSLLYPVNEIKDQDSAVSVMLPTGTPFYGSELGISYDKPVESLSTLAGMYRGLAQKVRQEDSEGWNQFIELASNPRGVSCEYCCGVGPIGATKDGRSRCGCQHNPGALSVALYLSAYTDLSDAEILKEVYNWKTLWFPADMVRNGLKASSGDVQIDSPQDLPGMVGGC